MSLIIAGAKPGVRRSLITAGLREPQVLCTATAADARERVAELVVT